MTSTECHFGSFSNNNTETNSRRWIMFKNKNQNSNNICGINVKNYRKAAVPKLSQRALADLLQLEGLDVDKNAIQRIESGQRFVTDIELVYLARVLNISAEQLLELHTEDE